MHAKKFHEVKNSNPEKTPQERRNGKCKDCADPPAC